MGRFKRTFTPEHEEILIAHVKDLTDRLMPFNKTEFLDLAYKLAESLNITISSARKKSLLENISTMTP